MAEYSGITANNELSADRTLRADRGFAFGGAGREERIDRLAMPAAFRFTSIFGAILDDQNGGSFALSVEEPGSVKQMYLPNTNVLIALCLRRRHGRGNRFYASGQPSGRRK